MPKLIKTTLLQAQASGGKVHILWDAEVKGFGARIQPKGIAFVFSYRHGAIDRRMTIGTLGELTVEMARRKAADLKLQVARRRHLPTAVSRGFPSRPLTPCERSSSPRWGARCSRRGSRAGTPT